MLWELSASEQRYRAVLEVGIGVPVTEAAGRYGVSRQTVHAGKTATVICENTYFRVVIDGETAAVVPRTTTSEIHRCKANATGKRSRPGLPGKDGDPHAAAGLLALSCCRRRRLR